MTQGGEGITSLSLVHDLLEISDVQSMDVT